MKKLSISLTFVCVIVFANAQQYDTLFNKTIISLSKIGLPPQTIINKIQTSITQFDVSINALLDLQANGVNGEVINEMIKRNDKENIQTGKEVNSNNPNTAHKPGIYYYNSKIADYPLKRIDPTITSTNKSGGFGTALAQKYTMGLAKDKIKSNLAGGKSHLQINSTYPEFYFYFENNNNTNSENWFFATATSPNEFVLVQLNENRNSREMVVGDANAYGSSLGISNKIKVSFEYVEITEGIYKVTVKQPLQKGEYCFIYASATPSMYNNNKVFDFGISVE